MRKYAIICPAYRSQYIDEKTGALPPITGGGRLPEPTGDEGSPAQAKKAKNREGLPETPLPFI